MALGLGGKDLHADRNVKTKRLLPNLRRQEDQTFLATTRQMAQGLVGGGEKMGQFVHQRQSIEAMR